MRRLLPQIFAAAFFSITCVVAAKPALERGLVAHLPMRADLRDHAPASREVTISGRVELRDGAAFFGGKEDWLELPHIPLNDRPFAVAVWLKPTGDGPTYGVLEQWDRSESGHVLHLMIREGLRPWLGFYMNDVVSPVSLSNTGAWQHVVFQYNGSQQEIWINGRLICRRAANAYRGTEGRTLIGKNPKWSNVPQNDYQGWMSDFRIYGRAITFEEIVALAAARPGVIAVKEAAAPAPQAAGSVAPDGVSEVPMLSISAERMQLRGQPGVEYLLEASEDLQKWEVLGTLTVGSDGVANFLDEDAHLFQQRFYRIRFGPAK